MSKKRVIKRRIVAYGGSQNSNNAVAHLECGHSEAISYELAKITPAGLDANCWRCTNSFAAKIGMPFGIKTIFLIKRKEQTKPVVDVKVPAIVPANGFWSIFVSFVRNLFRI